MLDSILQKKARDFCEGYIALTHPYSPGSVLAASRRS